MYLYMIMFFGQDRPQSEGRCHMDLLIKSVPEGKEAADARCDASSASGIAACSAQGPEAAVHRFGRFAAAAMRGGGARRLRVSARGQPFIHG